MKTFPLEIVAIDRVFFDGDCESLVVPAMDGEYGIMANHEPVVLAIMAGELRFTAQGKHYVLAVGEGLIEVSENDVTVLVDFAENADEIDVIRAKEAKQRAEERLQSQRDQVALAHAEAALSRAIARIRVSKTAGRTKL